MIFREVGQNFNLEFNYFRPLLLFFYLFISQTSCSVYQSNSRKQFESRASELSLSNTSSLQNQNRESGCRWLTPKDFEELLLTRSREDIFYSESERLFYSCSTSVRNSVQSL
jgi:hypothetical protein